MIKIAGEANTTTTEMEDTILKMNINNWTINTTNILEVLENLQYLIQSNIGNQIFQIQRMLVDELDMYKE